jgi:hypothetical protein
MTKLMTDRPGARTDLLDSILHNFAPNYRRLTTDPGSLEALTIDSTDCATVSIEKLRVLAYIRLVVDGCSPTPWFKLKLTIANT